jgi:hypothetical protein
MASRCLEKNARERWQSAADVLWLLKDVNGSFRQMPVKSRPRYLVARVTAGAVVAIGAGALLSAFRRMGPAGQPVRFVILPPDGTAFSDPPQFAISPDGRAVAFVASAATEKPALCAACR